MKEEEEEHDRGWEKGVERREGICGRRAEFFFFPV
jgi:hypothetical protein